MYRRFTGDTDVEGGTVLDRAATDAPPQFLQDVEWLTEFGSRLWLEVTRARGVIGILSCVRSCQWLTFKSDGWWKQQSCQHTQVFGYRVPAHTSVWIPSEFFNPDEGGRKCFFAMLTSGAVLLFIRQQPIGVQAFRGPARRHNSRSQARSLAQLQEISFLNFSRSQLLSQIEFLCLKDSSNNMRLQVGEALGAYVKCAVSFTT